MNKAEHLVLGTNTGPAAAGNGVSLGIPRSSTAPRKRLGGPRHPGWVSLGRLKRDCLAGVDYFWNQRPPALRPDPVRFYFRIPSRYAGSHQ